MKPFFAFSLIIAFVLPPYTAADSVREYRSISELPGEKREAFRRVYAEYKAAEARAEAVDKRLATEMPLVHHAVNETERLNREIHEAGRALEWKGDWTPGHREWKQRKSSVAWYGVTADLIANKNTRVYVLEKAKSYLDPIATGKRRNPPVDWDLLKSLLPGEARALSGEEAGRAFVEWLRRRAERDEPRVAELERSLRIPRDYIDATQRYLEKTEVVDYFQRYAEKHTPAWYSDGFGEGLVEAKQLEQIWPHWYMHYPSLAPDVVRNRNGMIFVIAINALVIAAIAVAIQIYRRRISGNGKSHSAAV